MSHEEAVEFAAEQIMRLHGDAEFEAITEKSKQAALNWLDRIGGPELRDHQKWLLEIGIRFGVGGCWRTAQMKEKPPDHFAE